MNSEGEKFGRWIGMSIALHVALFSFAVVWPSLLTLRGASNWGSSASGADGINVKISSGISGIPLPTPANVTDNRVANDNPGLYKNEPEPEPKAKAKERPRPRRPPRPKRPVRGVKTTDPWAVPEPEKVAPPEPAPPLEAYGVASEESARPAPKPRAQRKRKKEPEEEGYGLSGEEPPPRPKEMPLDGYRPVGEGRRDEPAPLPHPFLQGVYTFPWSANSLAPWAALTAGGLAMGGLLALLLSFWAQLQ